MPASLPALKNGRRTRPEGSGVILECAEAGMERRARAVLRRLPPMAGRPIRMERVPGLRDGHGPVHAGAFLHERRVAFDCAAGEFARIFTHELFHFVWWKAGNPARRSFERLVAKEWRAGARGELGWAAEWRKNGLSAADIRGRSRRWREYCAESFCDTAGWFYSVAGPRPARGLARGRARGHGEFTLEGRFRPGRRVWLRAFVKDRQLSI
jgi:hypothetical protein